MKMDSYESRFTRGLPDWCFLTVKIRLGDFYLRVFKCPITSADFQKLLRQIFRNCFGRFSENASADCQVNIVSRELRVIKITPSFSDARPFDDRNSL